MKFYDAAHWAGIPPESYAALYRDGEYAAPLTAPAQLRLTGHRWITVTGDYRNSGIIDWEPGNPCYTPSALRAFVRGRRRMGARARVYCDRADAAEALDAVMAWLGGDLGIYPGLSWWIATLDNQNWTAETLSDELAARWDAPIPAGRLWANQNVRGTDYDTSTLFGDW